VLDDANIRQGGCLAEATGVTSGGRGYWFTIRTGSRLGLQVPGGPSNSPGRGVSQAAHRPSPVRPQLPGRYQWWQRVPWPAGSCTLPVQA